MTLSNNLSLKKGGILISPPLMTNDCFYNSVIIITEYSENGVIGFIINKPLKFDFTDYLDGFPKFEGKTYLGGPVATNNIYFIHRVPEKIDNSMHIINDLYWSGNFNQVKSLIYDKKLTDNEIRFFLGYSGWEINQLQNEIKSMSWIIEELNFDFFDCDINNLWKNILELHEEKYKIWINAPINFHLN